MPNDINNVESLPKLQEKRAPGNSIESNKRQKANIDFNFQDETRISVPLQFLKKFPKSLLSITIENQNNYMESEDTYYIDSPSFSIKNTILFMEDVITLDSLTVNEVFDVYDTIKYLFDDEAIEYIVKIEEYKEETIKEFKINYCYDDEDNYDKYNDENKIIIKVDFSEDIPYEYIYPSNLHVIFPKLEIFEMKIGYYRKEISIRIPSSNCHYLFLYKEYNNIQEHSISKCNLFINDEIKGVYPYDEDYEITTNNPEDSRLINDKTIRINNNNNNNKNIRDDIETTEQENDEEKPDLFVHNIFEYSREYNEEQMKLEQLGDNHKEKTFSLFTFTYNHNNEIKDLKHPILKQSYTMCYDILKYILNIPICKNIKEIDTECHSRSMKQLYIPPLLKVLKEGFLDNLESIDIMNFIRRIIPEYIQLFKDILTTHVFPNITTLEIKKYPVNDFDMFILKDILLFITKEHFPKLHIYNIHNCFRNSLFLETIHVLFPISLLNIIDTIYTDCNSYTFGIPINLRMVENLMNTKDIHVESNCIPYTAIYERFWLSLYRSGILNINTLCLNLNEIHNSINDYSLLDFNLFPFKCLYIVSEFELNDNNSLFYEFMNFLCAGNYETVTELKITPFINFLFQNEKCIELPLWKNIEYIKMNLNDEEYQYKSVLSFFESFKDIPIDCLNTKSFSCFREYEKCENEEISHATENYCELFPSFSFYIHKPVYKIDTIISQDDDIVCTYNEYIYNQLKMKYTENIRSLKLYVYDEDYMTKYIDLITKGTFKYLNYLYITPYDYDFDFCDYDEQLNDYKKNSNPHLIIKYEN
ncbi:hypothetical protein WA158_006345 [Blastocystis sp. Blastoise]